MITNICSKSEHENKLSLTNILQELIVLETFCESIYWVITELIFVLSLDIGESSFNFFTSIENNLSFDNSAHNLPQIIYVHYRGICLCYGQLAISTHPTGMHSSFQNISLHVAWPWIGYDFNEYKFFLCRL